MKSVVVGWMFGLGLLLSHVGCCSVRMMGDGCGSGRCGGGCSDGCDSLSFSDHMAPFAGIGHRVADHIRSKHCSSGCGEIYWDEQINEPPVCDPCGCDGEFTGDACRSCPTALRRLRNLWSHHRYQPSNCDSCSSCGGDAGLLGASTCSSCSSGSGENVSMHTNLEPTQSMRNQSMQSPSVQSPSVQSPSKQSNPSRRSVATENDSSRTQPTPAVRPLRAAPPELRSMPVPDPDPNAMIRYPSQNGLSVGSGTSNKGSSVASQQVVKAKSVSSKPTQGVQGRPSSVTNPR
ncbi:MAG: hypothetical protein NTU79_05975 [Planctomycetota bacterium]|nr:hypothetical protein [Planctomycetota bacterium]